MSASYCKIQVLGYVDGELDELVTEKKAKVTKFYLRATQAWVDADGGKYEEIQRYQVITWGKLGFTCAKFLAAGRLVMVTGLPRMKQYAHQPDINVERLQILAKEVLFLDRPRE